MEDFSPDDVALSPEQCRPVNLDLRIPEQELRVIWADGVSSVFSAAQLRRHCPCATCRADRAPASALPILSARRTGEARAVGAALVGHYAIQIDWSDSHNTGIYDFRLLRQLHDRG